MKYIKVEKENVTNGDGLRVVLWLLGCSHHCYNCQNPETWNNDIGIEFDDFAEEKIFSELKKPYIAGITISGGDPLFAENVQDTLNFVNKIRVLFPDKNIWLYTGYTWEEIFNSVCLDSLDESIYHAQRQELVKQCDVLIDGRYIDSLRDITLKWRGSSNQRVIDVKKTLQKGEIELYTD